MADLVVQYASLSVHPTRLRDVKQILTAIDVLTTNNMLLVAGDNGSISFVA